MSFMDKWRENREHKRVEREQAEAERQAAAKAAWEASPEGQAAAARAQRLKDIEELKAKLLNPPPQRMAAAIKIWEKDYDELRPTIDEHKADINSGHKPFIVDLYVVPSEEERQIITSFKLTELILDDEPRFTPEEVNRYAQASATVNADIARINGRRGDYSAMDEQMDEWGQQEVEECRRLRHYTKLQDFFDFPYTRAFPTSHDAHSYAVRLREELLPKVRQFIEDYRDRKTEETFTV